MEKYERVIMRINGETEGLKNSVLAELDALYDLLIPQDSLWTEELLLKISYISADINRELALYLDRKGHIIDVSVGNNSTVGLSAVEGKRNISRLSGIRCIHTHPNGSGLLSAPDISSLKILRLDAMIAVGVRNRSPQDIFVGILSAPSPGEVEMIGPYSPDHKDFAILLERIADADKTLRKTITSNKHEEERAILVGLYTRDSHHQSSVNEADVSFSELEELTHTAGAIVVGHLRQKRDTRNSTTIVGQGKIEELRLLAQTAEANIVIFDEELTGAQQRNIEKAVGLKVLTRTSLILDIFAQRARSREGILQVELAQMQYQLPRLMGVGQALSRLGGGIGTRGPGETKLETDRRTIRRRIAYLKEQLSDIRRQREVLRTYRKKSGIPVVSIVGYTNAGKSTLLNTLCGADVLAEDKLFATLDTATRKLVLNNGSTVLLTDTVGFIRKLPPNLLDAFKSTLEEVALSDLILIVVDASDPQVDDHVHIVDKILAELGAGSKPAMVVLNKTDKSTTDNPVILLHEDRQIVEISAKHGTGLDELKQAIESALYTNRVQVQLSIPFSDGALISWLYAHGNILDVAYSHSATLVKVELDKQLLVRVGAYLSSE
ncbi:MAG: GTPase HflX [Desulfitobacteriaceae bacterium]